MRAMGVTAVLLIALVGLAGAPVHADQGQPTKEEIGRLAQRADLIIAGQVRRVGTPPNQYPGVAWVGQDVSYLVREQFKGPQRLQKVDITHPIVRDSPDAVGKGHLSKRRFRPGARLIVFAQSTEGGRHFVALCSPLDDTPENRELLQEAGVRP